MLRFVMAVNSFITDLWNRYGDRVRKVVHFAVLVACTVVVVIQLSECFFKLSQPPVSAFARIVVNKSMSYPAVTICRYPSYKTHVLKKYNLNDVRATSEYVNFPFENETLENLWKEATYKKDEVLMLSGLSSGQENIRVKSTFSVMWGRCHTVIPLVQTMASGIKNGFSIMLNEISDAESNVDGSKTKPEVGWYIFLHSATDPWIESTQELEGVDESIFVMRQEEVHVKIGVQEYYEVNKGNDHCNNSYFYSAVECEHLCKTKILVKKYGCTGPWLADVGAPLCNNATATDNLLSDYLNNISCDESCCSCMRSCHSLQFTPYIMRRYEMKSNSVSKLSHIYLYYTSRRIELSEERLAYDWSLFLADLGGSLGFLLGLSVLGIIGIVERLIDMLFGNLQPPWRKQSLMSKQGKDNALQLSNRLKSMDEGTDCSCCSLDKNLNIHNMATLKCADKFDRNPYDGKY